MKQFRLRKAPLAFVSKLQNQILLVLVLQWSTNNSMLLLKSMSFLQHKEVRVLQ